MFDERNFYTSYTGPLFVIGMRKAGLKNERKRQEGGEKTSHVRAQGAGSCSRSSELVNDEYSKPCVPHRKVVGGGLQRGKRNTKRRNGGGVVAGVEKRGHALAASSKVIKVDSTSSIYHPCRPHSSIISLLSVFVSRQSLPTSVDTERT